MNSETGKWNWAKFKDFSNLMENDMLKEEATIMHKACFDGKLYNIYFNNKLFIVE